MIKHLEQRARLPRMGILRLGIATRCGKDWTTCRQCWRSEGKPGAGHPREVPYFVLPPDLKAKLGIGPEEADQPRALRVLFPSDDTRVVLPNDYTLYSGPLITRKCDGETCIVIPRKGRETIEPCMRPPYEVGQRPEPCKGGCRATARLNVILFDAPLGIYQVLIGGEQRIADLLTQLMIYKRQLGRLTDVPFLIERIATSSQRRTADDERIATTGYPVQVRCSFTARQVLEALRAHDPTSIPALAAATLDLAGEAGEAALHPEEALLDQDPDPGDEGDAASPCGDAERGVPDEWDLSMGYKAAKDLGLDATVYGRYLDHAYGDRDNLGVQELTAQRLMFEKVGDPAKRDAVKRAILAGAAQGPGGPGGPGSVQGRML